MILLRNNKKSAFINLTLIVILLIIVFLSLVIINAKKAILEAQRVSIGWSNERGEPENCNAVQIKTKAKKSYQKYFKDNEFCSIYFEYNSKKDNKMGQVEFEVNFWVDVVADILIVGGGGGGGSVADGVQNSGGGGGGAGGFVYQNNVKFKNNIKYKVAVGKGGDGGDDISVYRGYNGKNSQFGDFIAFGGGGGGAASQDKSLNSGLSGGSGGGAGSIAQLRSSWQIPGRGGLGIENDITGLSVTYAKGGDGGWYYDVSKKNTLSNNGLGNGGSGGSVNDRGSAGGSGIVVINYKIAK